MKNRIIKICSCALALCVMLTVGICLFNTKAEASETHISQNSVTYSHGDYSSTLDFTLLSDGSCQVDFEIYHYGDSRQYTTLYLGSDVTVTAPKTVYYDDKRNNESNSSYNNVMGSSASAYGWYKVSGETNCYKFTSAAPGTLANRTYIKIHGTFIISLPNVTARTNQNFTVFDRVEYNDKSVSPSSSSVTMYRTYPITFDSNGGSAVSNITKYHGINILLPEAPQKDGYIFNGWAFKDNTNIVMNAKQIYSNNEARDFVASWILPSHTVTFDYNLLDGSSTSKTISEQDPIPFATVTPTLDGYELLGWSTDSNATRPIDVSAITMGTSDVTYYAVWGKNIEVKWYEKEGAACGASNYTLNYNAKTKTLESVNVTMPSVSDFTSSSTSKIGSKQCSLLGWSKDASANSTVGKNGADTISASTTYCAVYTYPVTVSYLPNNGSTITPDTQTAKVSSWYFNNASDASIAPASFTLAPAQTKVGSTFGNWKDQNTTTLYAANGKYTSTKDTTMEAVYGDQMCSVAFDTDGGSIDSWSNDYKYGTQIACPTQTIAKQGYTFNGWKYVTGGTVTWPIELTESVSLKVDWIAIDYTVTYKTDNGVEDKVVIHHFGDKLVPKTDYGSDPIKPGYSFKEWQYNNTASSIPTTMPSHDMVITAFYNTNSYTLKFVDSMSTSSVYASITAFYGANISDQIPVNPDKAGYTFTGWYEDKDCNNLYSIGSTMPILGAANNATKTIYAGWEAIDYTVTYRLNNGLENIVQHYNFGQSITKPSNPVKSGYTFLKWSPTIPSTLETPDNMIFDAEYTINQYTYNFDSNGGSRVASITANYGDTVSLSSDPIKTGYTFAGWYEDSSLNAAYTFPGTMPALGASNKATKTLYAKWTINSHKITFVYNNGSENVEKTLNYNTKIEYPVPVKAGYTYNDQWLLNGVKAPVNMPDEDIVVEADYTIESYTIKFNTDGGSVVSPIIVTYGSPISLSESLKEGYTFDGWYTDSTKQVKFAADGYIGDLGNTGATINVYAKWITNKYTLTFVMNNGEDNVVSSVPYNETINKPTPVRDGYTFTGWTMSDNTTVPTKMPSHAVTMYAQYSINQYSLAFNTNGGTSITTIKQDYGTTINVVPVTIKTGYEFVGWYEDNNTFSVPFEIPETMPSFGKNGVTKTVYARWSGNTHTITYKLNNSLPDVVQTYTYGDTIEKIANPSKAGYTFSKWQEGSVPSTFNVDKDLVFTAVYTPNSYKLAFNTNGGSSISTISKAYGAEIGLVEDPTKAGYTFEGWYEDRDFTTVYTIPEKMPYLGAAGATKTIYAKWSKNIYTVTWKFNNGSDDVIYSYGYGDAILQPVDPAKTGYNFNGWSSTVPDTMPANNLTFSAKWSAISYKMYFNSNGGSAISAKTYQYGATVVEPSKPTKTGYTFVGWYADQDLEGDKFLFTTMPAHDVTLYAKWTDIAYTLAYTVDGSTYKTVQYGYKDAISPEIEPHKTGYTFAGWNPSVPTTMPANDLTVSAKWTLASYTINFNSCGGSSVSAIRKTYGSAVSAPTNPKMTGATFLGWYEDKSYSGEPYEFTTMPSHDVTLYAKWDVEGYTLTYTVDGEILDKHVYNYGDVLPIVTAPAKTGYVFSGWSSTIPETMPAKDLTVAAKYSRANYTITFDSQGGSSVSKMTKAYEAVIAAPTSPKLTGFSFDGWYDNPACEGTPYQFTTMPAKSFTLYAKWNTEGYTLTCYVDGSVFYKAAYEYEDKIASVPEPSKVGYRFIGWSSTIPETMPAKDITVNARFSTDTYTIVFSSQGGSSVSNITKAFGSSVTAPTAPKKTGSVFEGWYETPDCSGEKYEFTTMPNKNFTLYAKWAENIYTLTYYVDGELYNQASYKYGDVLPSVTAPVKTGYVFSGWDVTIPKTMPAKDIVANAKFKVGYYNIVFNSMGGSNVYKITKTYGASVTKPSDPKLTGFTFEGWYTDETCSGEQYVFTTMPSYDIILYAKWSTQGYALTYMVDDEVYVKESYQYGDIIKSVKNPEKDGYTFTGWSVTIPETMPAKDIIATAKWTANNYTITFETSGGSKVTAITKAYGAKVTAPSTPTKEGYVFVGWFITEDCSGEKYEFNVMPKENIKLYAKWSEESKTYKLTYKINGKSYLMEQYAVGQTIVPPVIEEKDGYKFSGWSNIVETMPAYDVVVTGTYSKSNISKDDETTTTTKNNDDKSDTDSRKTTDKDNQSTVTDKDDNKQATKESTTKSATDSKENLPKTGSTSSAIIAFVMLISACGVIYVLKKKEN